MDDFNGLLVEQLRQLREMSAKREDADEVVKLTEAMVELADLLAKNVFTNQMFERREYQEAAWKRAL